MGGELRDDFLAFGIQKCLYLHFRLSTWLQQRSLEVTSVSGADRLFRERERELESSVFAQFSSVHFGSDHKRGNVSRFIQAKFSIVRLVPCWKLHFVIFPSI